MEQYTATESHACVFMGVCPAVPLVAMWVDVIEMCLPLDVKS